LNEYLMRILVNDDVPLDIFWPAADSLQSLRSIASFHLVAYTTSTVWPRMSLLLTDDSEKWESYTIEFPRITYRMQTRRAGGSSLAKLWYERRLGRTRSKLKSVVMKKIAS
jgi:hypothetical protein